MGKKVLTVEDIFSKITNPIVEYPLVGGVIKIKGLTKEVQQKARKEAILNGEIDSDALEIAIFKAGVVEPKIDDEAITKIKQTMPAATFDAIVLKISELSGIDEDMVGKVKKS